MNISQERIDNLNSIVKVTIKPEDYTEKVDKAIKAQAKKAKVPGFRPGMVPAAHIKKMYGKSILLDEINNLLSESLNNYIEQNKLDVLGQPLPKVDPSKEFKWDYTDEFEFEYELGLSPDFDVEYSSGDSVTKYKIKLDPETLESRIKNIRKSYGKMTNPDVSEDNDVLYAELKQLSPDGSVFEDGFSNTSSLRLDLMKDEKVKQSLIGLKAGDEVTINLNEAYGNDAFQISKALNISEEDAKDLKSDFKLSVKNINRLEEADLNQEFFDKVFGKDMVTGEEEFRAKITEELEAMMEQNSDQKLNSDIIKMSLEKFNLELPDDFLKRWLKVSNEKLTDEELEGGYDDFAKNLKWTLIENKLIKANEIEIKYEDVFETAKQRLEAQFKMYSSQSISEEQLAQYTVQFLQDKENANKVFEDVKAQKVLHHLKSVLTLNEQEIEYNAFLELAQ